MFRRALAGIDYTSPVCKINIAVDKIPNFLADPNTSEHMVAPMMTVTIIWIYIYGYDDDHKDQNDDDR